MVHSKHRHRKGGVQCVESYVLCVCVCVTPPRTDARAPPRVSERKPASRKRAQARKRRGRGKGWSIVNGCRSRSSVAGVCRALGRVRARDVASWFTSRTTRPARSAVQVTASQSVTSPSASTLPLVERHDVCRSIQSPRRVWMSDELMSSAHTGTCPRGRARKRNPSPGGARIFRAPNWSRGPSIVHAVMYP